MTTATKNDILGLIDYLQETLGDYESPGRPYDDDELFQINSWAERCTVWLNQKIKEMP
jgi:hypothetical protein